MVNPTDDLAPLARAALKENFGLTASQVDDAALLAAIDQVIAALPEGSSSREFLTLLVDELPSPERALFQPPALWDWLTDEVLPPLIDSSFSRGRPLKLATVGCALGHEPFSLAMRVLDRFTLLGKSPAAAVEHTRVIGYDVSPRRVAQARSGQLSAFCVQQGRPEWARGWVQPEAAMPGVYKVHPAVTALCRFEQANLLALGTSEKLRLRGVDLLLCQQVLSDFEPDAARRSLGLLAEALPVGALVVVSPEEAPLLAGSPRFAATSYVGAASVTKVEKATPPERLEKSPAAPVALAAAEATIDLGELLSAPGAQSTPLALAHARALLLLAPDHLLARLVFAQRLLQAEPARARAMLEQLVEAAERLSPRALAAHGRGLTVEQIAGAAQQLAAKIG